MTYYTYHQNNSGGYFELPAIDVVVKADSPEQADAIAEANGIHFNSGCSCCGDRWSRASDFDASDVVPEITEDSIRYTRKGNDWSALNTLPQLVID